jgi:hypothetical protein
MLMHLALTLLGYSLTGPIGQSWWGLPIKLQHLLRPLGIPRAVRSLA